MQRLNNILESHRAALAAISPADRTVSFNPRGVFCNRELRLGGGSSGGAISHVGFDYDFTLACYKNPQLQALIHDLARDYLVTELKYKEQVGQLPYDPTFAIRGLAFDKKTGLMFKIDPNYYVDESCVFRGRRRLARAQVHAHYGTSLHLSQGYIAKHVSIMQDLFALPEASLLADIIELYDRLEIPYEPHYVYQDTRAALNAIHTGGGRSGGLHKAIMASIGEYVDTDTTIFELLASLRATGRKVFLLTNSPYEFVNAGMQHMLSRAQHSRCGPGVSNRTHWTAFFDIIICQAAKPSFFTDDRPLRRMDPLSGRMLWDRVTEFVPGAVYLHGNVEAFHALTKVSPERVLYFGDNLPADLISPSRAHSWRTAAIVRELEAHIEVSNGDEYFASSQRLQQIKDTLAQVSHLKSRVPQHCNAFLDVTMQDLREEHRAEFAVGQRLFNANFGSTFRCGDHMSQFSATLTRWSDIYLSRVEHLQRYGWEHAFFPRPQRMQHEMPPPTVARPVRV